MSTSSWTTKRRIGLVQTNGVRGTKTVLFEYNGARLDDPDRFSLEPALALGRGTFVPPTGLATFVRSTIRLQKSWHER
jgi:serine/threonine-protein kinase HipA